MFAIAFDLDIKDTKRGHPKGLTQAYADTRRLLADYGFEWRQGSFYTSDNENLAHLFEAISAPKRFRGLLRPSGIFALSVLNNGLTSLRW